MYVVILFQHLQCWKLCLTAVRLHEHQQQLLTCKAVMGKLCFWHLPPKSCRRIRSQNHLHYLILFNLKWLHFKHCYICHFELLGSGTLHKYTLQIRQKGLPVCLWMRNRPSTSDEKCGVHIRNCISYWMSLQHQTWIFVVILPRYVYM